MAFVIDASIVAAFSFGEPDDARVLMATEELKMTEALAPRLSARRPCALEPEGLRDSKIG